MPFLTQFLILAKVFGLTGPPSLLTMTNGEAVILYFWATKIVRKQFYQLNVHESVGCYGICARVLKDLIQYSWIPLNNLPNENYLESVEVPFI